jgi:DNA-binding NarL/FixJ family response regulator
MTAPIKVSIVDDDEAVRQNIALILRESPRIAFQNSYDSAEQALVGLPKAPANVVLMDIHLPQKSGIECVRQLKTQLPDVQFLMLTVYKDAAVIFEALEAGASGYMLKRTSPEKLIEAIVDVFEGGSPMSSQVARKVVQYFQRPGSKPAPEVHLSSRETEVLNLLAKGYLYKEIADQTALSIDTIKTYIRRVYEKLHVRSRSEAIAKYLQKEG